MIVVAYVVSAVLEIGGIALVAYDVRSDRQRARSFLGQPRRVRIPWPRTHSVQSYIEDREIEKGTDYGRMLGRQRSGAAEAQMQRVALGAAEAELEARQAIADILRGNVYRRVAGPVMIAVGIVVGMVANIAAA